ncbi:hypothetical protein SOVF_068560 [Spinacia oleracea]|nr:hypothetical protein SOVF_068560 [Spinacia oleracea]
MADEREDVDLVLCLKFYLQFVNCGQFKAAAASSQGQRV